MRRPIEKKESHRWNVPIKRGLVVVVVLFSAMVFATGCSVRRNQVVALTPNGSETVTQSGELNIPLDDLAHKASVEQAREQLKNLDSEYIPLEISKDYDVVFAYKRCKTKSNDVANQNIIIGKSAEYVNLYFIRLSDKSIKNLGVYLTPKDYKFDETGKLFAFIDGAGNVFTYNLETRKLHKVIGADQFNNLSTLSWSRDSKRLMIDTKLVFDLATGEFISIAAINYTPFIKYKFNDKVYITQMKNHTYNDIITLYDFDDGTYHTLAGGTYRDCDGSYLLYTREPSTGLNILNLKTMENTMIDNGTIYDAKILKSTGEIVYTMLDTSFQNDEHYVAVKYDIETKNTVRIPVDVPGFYVCPGEDRIAFVSDFMVNSYFIRLPGFVPEFVVKQTEDFTQRAIKNKIIRMFLLDYSSITDPTLYEEAAAKVFCNEYTKLPLEALKNKLLDFKKYGVPLAQEFKVNSTMPSELRLHSITIDSHYANVDLGMYYINSLDLIERNSEWFIAGLSTHVTSPEVTQVRDVTAAYLSKIKLQQKDAVKAYGDFNENFVNALLKSSHFSFTLGETELWIADGNHRAEYASSATNAKIKVNITQEGNTHTYKIKLKRTGTTFTIVGWDLNALNLTSYN